ncbi:MAG: hypothetical protein AAGG50_21400 [Bacteroidota bacterium]
MSRTPEEQIALYGSLSPAEQAEVEAHVEAHPALRPLLDDAKRLHALALHAATAKDAPLTEDDLAAALLADYLGPRSDHERALIARVRAAIDNDEALRATYDRLLQRLRALHEATASPRAQFEALTGRRLPTPTATSPVDKATAPRAADRPAVQAARPRRRAPVLRWAMAAVVLFGTVGLGLIATDSLLTPAHQERADLDGLTAALPILRAPVRGPIPADSAANRSRADIQAAYADALAEVEAAHESALFGLLDRYDSERLDRAAVLLRDVTTQQAVAPDLALDAAFAVGTIRLYQNRRSEACTAFERVVAEQGPRGAEAEALIAEFCTG